MVLQLSSQLDNAKAAIVTGVNRYIEGLQTSLLASKTWRLKLGESWPACPAKKTPLEPLQEILK